MTHPHCLYILVYYLLSLVGNVNLALLWNGNLSAFQIKIDCRSVFTDDDRRDSGRREVLEIIEGNQTGCFILCDVVERMTRINTVVQGDTGQTVHLVLCSRACLVGRERGRSEDS